METFERFRCWRFVRRWRECVRKLKHWTDMKISWRDAKIDLLIPLLTVDCLLESSLILREHRNQESIPRIPISHHEPEWIEWTIWTRFANHLVNGYIHLKHSHLCIRCKMQHWVFIIFCISFVVWICLRRSWVIWDWTLLLTIDQYLNRLFLILSRFPHLSFHLDLVGPFIIKFK